jgi:hypothetical protein
LIRAIARKALLLAHARPLAVESSGKFDIEECSLHRPSGGHDALGGRANGSGASQEAGGTRGAAHAAGSAEDGGKLRDAAHDGQHGKGVKDGPQIVMLLVIRNEVAQGTDGVDPWDETKDQLRQATRAAHFGCEIASDCTKKDVI